MSADFYRAAGASLDRYAADVDDCDANLITPCQRRLPDVIQGAATPWLEEQLGRCSDAVRSVANLIRTAAASARSTAAAIEAAELAEAAAAIEAAAAAGESESDLFF